MVGEGGKNRLGTVFAARGGGGELAASTADEDVPKPFGTELDVAGLFEDPPEEGDARGEGVDATREGVAEVVGSGVRDERVEGEEDGDVGVFADGAGGGLGGADAVLALERERGRREEERDDAERVEVLEQFAGGAAAGTAAEGGDEDGGAHAFERGVDEGGVVLEGRARRGGLPAGAASGETVPAEQHEGEVAGGAGLGVRVEDERADAGPVGAQDPARHPGSGAADADEEKG